MCPMSAFLRNVANFHSAHKNNNSIFSTELFCRSKPRQDGLGSSKTLIYDLQN